MRELEIKREREREKEKKKEGEEMVIVHQKLNENVVGTE